MSDDLDTHRRKLKKQLVRDQLREILQAENSLERRSACSRILENAGSVQIELYDFLAQLRALAKETGRPELDERIKQLMLDADLEMLAFETIFEGYPEDWNDND